MFESFNGLNLSLIVSGVASQLDLMSQHKKNLNERNLNIFYFVGS